jgi:peptidoglycan-associated lipoprotein
MIPRLRHNLNRIGPIYARIHHQDSTHCFFVLGTDVLGEIKIMLTRLIPALCAALLLAACGSGADQNSPDATNMAATGEGANGGISSSGNGVNGTGMNGGVVAGSLDEFNGPTVGNTVHFDTDKYTLNSEAQAVLQKEAAWLKQYPQHTATIEGHSDERGTREYNLALGERRAQTVLNYLVALGVDANRLKEVSYGKERPICPDTGEACWAQNRRGVTTLDN